MTIQDLDKKILKTVLYLNCQGCNRTKIKNKKGVFVMDTKTMFQFEIMDTEMLDHIEGGDVSDIYKGYANQVSPLGSYPSVLKNSGPFPVSGYCPRGYRDLGYIGAGFHLCGI